MELTYLHGDITKTEKTDDGLVVEGKATGPDLDIDKQICDPGWLAKAMPAWMEWGNVREGHSPLAAGVGLELAQDGADWHLKSLCVDPGTQRKLETGVLKGYSIGIKGARVVKDAQAPGGRIVGGDIVEISYVDRPSNGTCKTVIVKSAGGGADLEPVDEDGKSVEADVVKKDLSPDPEMIRKGAEAVAGMAALPDFAKAAADGDQETSDIDGARQAIALIARLVQSEAAGLAAGQMNEASDIDCLLDAVRALQWFCERESLEPQGDVMDLISLGVNADTVKAALAEDATDEQKSAPLAELKKALGLEDVATKAVVADAVKEAVADTLKGVEERLATVEQMAAPGGAARTRSQQDTAKAAAVDRLASEAARFRHLAETVTDTTLATGYRLKAAALDRELAGITPQQ